MTRPEIVVLPGGARSWLADAVAAGGADVVDAVTDAQPVVWTSASDAAGLRTLLDTHPAVPWVQLPFAGVEPFRDVLDEDRVWTCGKGVYADPVAEMALTHLLAGMRGVLAYGQRTSWSAPQGVNLFDARVTILGGGGITEALIGLLRPFRCEITVMRRSDAPLDGASVIGPDRLHDVLPRTDALVLALALTPETAGIIGAEELALLPDHAWISNVARGRHIDTAALVAALESGTIGGAALDVTDPEPLPDGHPLWGFENVVITPHVGNTPEMAVPLLSARVTENVRRWIAGSELLGPVDPVAGY